MMKFIFLFALTFSCQILTAQVSGSGYMQVDDDSIFYEWAGTGETILLIHDGLLNREVWDHQFAFFSNSYEVVRYDRRGYGASSSATVPYTHLAESFENDFEEGLFYILDDPYEIYIENSDAKEKALELFKRYPPKESRRQTYVRPEVPAFRRLNEIKIPALILAGEFDIPDVHAHAGAINAGILNSKRVVVPKSGHLIPMEQPESFNEAVMEFLMEIPR